jgi:hypothetical protein
LSEQTAGNGIHRHLRYRRVPAREEGASDIREPRSKLALVAAALLAGVVVLALGGLAYAATSGHASAAQYQYKITICHHTKGKGGTHHVTISVSVRAWPAHQRHGDTMGPCSSQPNVATHSRTSHVKKFHPKRTLKAEQASEKKEKQEQKGKGKGKGKGKP